MRSKWSFVPYLFAAAVAIVACTASAYFIYYFLYLAEWSATENANPVGVLVGIVLALLPPCAAFAIWRWSRRKGTVGPQLLMLVSLTLFGSSFALYMVLIVGSVTLFILTS